MNKPAQRLRSLILPLALCMLPRDQALPARRMRSPRSYSLHSTSGKMGESSMTPAWTWDQQQVGYFYHILPPHSARTRGRWKDAGIRLPALTQLSLRGPEIKCQLYFLTSVPDVSLVNPEQAQALETKLQLSLYSSAAMSWDKYCFHLVSHCLVPFFLSLSFPLLYSLLSSFFLLLSIKDNLKVSRPLFRDQDHLGV